MSSITRLIDEASQGDNCSAEQLLATVYDELRNLAAQRMAHEKPGQTLQATALVHDAWLRLVQGTSSRQWKSRGHFFAAASEAMRRILIEQARRKTTQKRQGNRISFPVEELVPGVEWPADEFLDLNEALEKLAQSDRQCAELVKLRLFAGFTVEEAGELLEIPERTAYRNWKFAKAWLYRALNSDLHAENERSDRHDC